MQNHHEQSQKSFLAAFLLTISFGLLGLRHFYLGDKKLGWIRTGILAGGSLLAFSMAASNQLVLTLIGILLILAAYVWAIIDFFYVYFSVKNDAAGLPLLRSGSDQAWARGIFMVTIGFTVLVMGAAVTIGALVEQEVKQQLVERQRMLDSARQQLTTPQTTVD